jgi:hypothetical protein
MVLTAYRRQHRLREIWSFLKGSCFFVALFFAFTGFPGVRARETVFWGGRRKVRKGYKEVGRRG